MKKTMMITPESGRPSDVGITLPWLRDRDRAERGDGDPDRLAPRTRSRFTLAICVPRAATRL